MPRITVILKGGLGNQMFQYAFAKALAKKNNATLVLDAISGFARDTVYKRRYALGKLNIPPDVAVKRSGSLLYLYELFLEKFGILTHKIISKRLYGSYVKEVSLDYSGTIMNAPLTEKNILINGFWQNEKFFSEIEKDVYNDFTLSDRKFPALAALAAALSRDNSVAVCVRLFEDIPGDDKSGVGGLTQFSFYEKACDILKKENGKLKYFVFSTTSSLVKNKLRLDGDVEYITADEEYENEEEVLWLLAHCRKQVIANSSFYWWGAWLAEKKNGPVKIIASRTFANPDSVPQRWRTEWENIYEPERI